MKNWSKAAVFILFAAIFTGAVPAQTTGQSSVSDLQKRIEELEKQIKTISLELAKIQTATE